MRGGLETVRLAVRGIGPSLEGSLLLFLSTGLSDRPSPARSRLQLLPLPPYSTVTKWAMSCPRQQSPHTIDVFLWVLKASALQRLGLTLSVVSTFWVSRFQNTNPCLLSSLGCWCPAPPGAVPLSFIQATLYISFSLLSCPVWLVFLARSWLSQELYVPVCWDCPHSPLFSWHLVEFSICPRQNGPVSDDQM